MLKKAMTNSHSGSLVQIVNGLFNRSVRKQFITLPTITGGIKEYYNNVQAIARHSTEKLKEIYDALEKEDEYKHENRLRDLFGQKLNEIGDALMFIDVDRFIDKLYEKLLQDPNIVKKMQKRLESKYANEL